MRDSFTSTVANFFDTRRTLSFASHPLWCGHKIALSTSSACTPPNAMPSSPPMHRLSPLGP
jgi:hypothetical protein